MDDPDSKPQTFLKKHGGLIIALVPIIGAIVTVWMKVDYVIDTIDPKVVLEFRVKEALLDQKRDLRWCLGKVVIKETFTKQEILDCAD